MKKILNIFAAIITVSLFTNSIVACSSLNKTLGTSILPSKNILPGLNLEISFGENWINQKLVSDNTVTNKTSITSLIESSMSIKNAHKDKNVTARFVSLDLDTKNSSGIKSKLSDCDTGFLRNLTNNYLLNFIAIIKINKFSKIEYTLSIPNIRVQLTEDNDNPVLIYALSDYINQNIQPPTPQKNISLFSSEYVGINLDDYILPLDCGIGELIKFHKHDIISLQFQVSDKNHQNYTFSIPSFNIQLATDYSDEKTNYIFNFSSCIKKLNKKSSLNNLKLELTFGNSFAGIGWIKQKLISNNYFSILGLHINEKNIQIKRTGNSSTEGFFGWNNLNFSNFLCNTQNNTPHSLISWRNQKTKVNDYVLDYHQIISGPPTDSIQEDVYIELSENLENNNDFEAKELRLFGTEGKGIFNKQASNPNFNEIMYISILGKDKKSKEVLNSPEDSFLTIKNMEYGDSYDFYIRISNYPLGQPDIENHSYFDLAINIHK